MSLLLLLGAGATVGGMAVSTPTGVEGVMVAGSTLYSASAEFRAATDARSCLVHIEWFDGDGASVGFSSGSSVVNSTSGWTEAAVADTSPSGAVYAAVIAEVVGAASSEVHYVDKVGFYLRNDDPLWDPGEPASGGSLGSFDETLLWMSIGI